MQTILVKDTVSKTEQLRIINQWFSNIPPTHYFVGNTFEYYAFKGKWGEHEDAHLVFWGSEFNDELHPLGIFVNYEELSQFVLSLPDGKFIY